MHPRTLLEAIDQAAHAALTEALADAERQERNEVARTFWLPGQARCYSVEPAPWWSELRCAHLCVAG